MLSIIIPTLNEEKYLPLLLESIKKQNFKDLEIIVADANSEDKTVEIAKRYGCKAVRGGLPAKGRNQGAAVAKGELLLFLDAETILPKYFLENILSKFKEKNLDIVSCSLEPITEKKSQKIYKIFYDLFYNWPANFLEDAFPYASSLILVKKEIHQKIGGFDEEIKIAEDHAYARAAAKIGKFNFLKSLKLPFLPRRYQKEGIIKTSLKYYLCNLYNIFLGEVKSDIFNYNFGQYKKEKNPPKSQRGIFRVLKFLFQIPWAIVQFILVIAVSITWLVVFLIFTPKIINLRIQSLFKKIKK